jgi:hypothetical protein
VTDPEPSFTATDRPISKHRVTSAYREQRLASTISERTSRVTALPCHYTIESRTRPAAAVGLALQMIFGNDPPVERLVDDAVTAALQFWRDGAWFPRHYQTVNLFFNAAGHCSFILGGGSGESLFPRPEAIAISYPSAAWLLRHYRTVNLLSILDTAVLWGWGGSGESIFPHPEAIAISQPPAASRHSTASWSG